MKVHHLNFMSFCPLGGGLIHGKVGKFFKPPEMICHCLLIETEKDLILVDSGIGLKDLENPKKRLGAAFIHVVRPKFSEEETAIRQIQKLGLDPKDVTHIILTHLDLDHAGGISDFPNAKVHLLKSELTAAEKTNNIPLWQRRLGYRPVQWDHEPYWQTYEASKGENWFGFDCVKSLEGLPPEILMVPLLGHSPGHCGVAIQTNNGWILHAGDAYFFHEEIDPNRPSTTPLLFAFQNLIQEDSKTRKQNLNRLRELNKNHSSEVSIFCSHDVTEFGLFV